MWSKGTCYPHCVVCSTSSRIGHARHSSFATSRILQFRKLPIAMHISDATAKRDVAKGRAKVLLLASREPTLCDYLRYLGGNES
jgi:hypothetical protein